MPDTSIPEDIRQKPVNDVVEDIMQQSRRALESGARATAEVEELKRRAEEALDWRTQLNRHRWLVAGIAASIVAAVLLGRRDERCT